MKQVLFAISAVAAVSAPAHAASIVNGSFESGIPAGVFTNVLGGNSSDITGWTVGGHSVDYIGSYWGASNGERSIDLAGSGIGSVSQDIVTVAGTTYRVTFDVSRNPDGGLDPRTGFVDVGAGFTTVTFGNISSSSGNMMWETRTYDFTASSALTSLRFSADPATSNGYYGLALDNVRIETLRGAVPEPTTWALMILGFGAIGASMRRRVRATVRYA